MAAQVSSALSEATALRRFKNQRSIDEVESMLLEICVSFCFRSSELHDEVYIRFVCTSKGPVIAWFDRSSCATALVSGMLEFEKKDTAFASNAK